MRGKREWISLVSFFIALTVSLSFSGVMADIPWYNVDNSDAGFNVVQGTWSTASNCFPFYSPDYTWCSSRVHNDDVYWVSPITPANAGCYRVFVRWPDPTSCSPSPLQYDKAVYQVWYNGGLSSFKDTLNQNSGGGQYIALGTFHFTGHIPAGENVHCIFDKNLNPLGDDYVIADGVDFVPVPDTAWVDDNWIGSSYGDSLVLPIDINSPGPDTVVFGYNAFDNVQDGIDGVCGSIVWVLPGTYVGATYMNTDNVELLSVAGPDSTILSRSGQCPLFINADSVTIGRSGHGFTITSSGEHGIRVEGDYAGIEVHFNYIINNSVGLYNTSSDTVHAENNWWGSCTGPYHPIRNPQGMGGAIEDGPGFVDFDPWLFPCAVGDRLFSECLTHTVDDFPDEYLEGSNDPTGDWWAVAFYNPGGVARVSTLSFRFWDPGTINLYVFTAGDSLPDDGLCASGLLYGVSALLGDSLAPGAERSFLGLGLTQWEETELDSCITVGAKSWFFVAWQKKWDEYPRIIGDDTGGAGSHSWIWNAEMRAWKCFPNLEYSVEVCLEYNPDCVALLGVDWDPHFPCVCETYEVGAMFEHFCPDGEDKELLVSFWNAPFGLFTLPGIDDEVCVEASYTLEAGTAQTIFCSCAFHHDTDTSNVWARSIAVKYNPDVTHCIADTDTVYRFKRFPVMTVWPDAQYGGTYGPIAIPVMNDEGMAMQFDVAIDYSGPWSFQFAANFDPDTTLWLDPMDVDTLYLIATATANLPYVETVLITASKCNGGYGELIVEFMPYSEPLDVQPISVDSLRISKWYPCEDSTRFDVGITVINEGGESAYPTISFGMAEWGFFFEPYAQYDTTMATAIGGYDTVRVDALTNMTPFFLWRQEGRHFYRNVLVDYPLLLHHCELAVDSVEVVFERDCRRIIWPGHRWPWDGEVIPIPVHNEEAFDDTITLSVEAMPPGWLHFLSKYSVPLAPGATDTAYLSVIPQGVGPPVPPNHVAMIRALKGFCDRDTGYCPIEFLPYACVCIPDYLGEVVENIPGQEPYLVPGDTVEVNIMLENDIDVTGIELDLLYDSQYLLPDTTLLTWRSAGMYLNEGVTSPDTYHVFFDFRTGPTIDPSILGEYCEQISSEDSLKVATVLFLIIDDPQAGTCSNIYPENVVVMGLPDPDDEPKGQICACENHGQICFGGYKFPMKCDVNEDSSLTLFDIWSILMHIIRQEMLVGPIDIPGTPLWGADANGDHIINILDLMKCINKTMGRLDPKLGMPVAAVSVAAEMDVLAGRGIEIPLGLTAEEPLAGALYRLRYDRSFMDIDQPELTKRSGSMSLEWGTVGDEVWVLVYSQTGEVMQAGVGEVVNLPFQVADGATGQEELFLEQTILFLVNERITFADPATVTLKTVSLVPTEFSLSQNYPNPFNPETDIRYGLPKDSHVRLEVFNLLGQRVEVLVDERQEAGYYHVRWDGGEMASGVYFYRIQANEYTTTKRMVLMK